MHPLVAALADWPGRPTTKARLEALGFWLPERYKEIVLANCGGCTAEEVERYWDEMALEYFCSAGRVQSTRRQFGIETSYRSKYLDELASTPENRDAASLGHPLHPCLRVFKNNSLSNVEPGILLNQRIAEQMEEQKRGEIENLAISATNWSGTKEDTVHYLQQAAESRGFVRKKGMWRKTFGKDLEFCCGVDTGRRVSWTFRLPLVLQIAHKSAPDVVFVSVLANTLMPGFHYYALYESPGSAILGIHAHIALFNTIGELMQ